MQPSKPGVEKNNGQSQHISRLSDSSKPTVNVQNLASDKI